ncbi:MAG: outer membrane beta-barrel protein [Gammaproteobacteria bacterium]|nr:outer membrane beta-barrel protein [Gammaproteobacteria bacterium]
MTLTKYSTPLPSLIMTVTTITLAVFITVGVYGKQSEATWFIIGGLSVYSEGLGETIDYGGGVRVGAGVQLNETFGAEIVRDFIPDIGAVGSNIILNAIGLENEVTATGYVYSTVFGTAKTKIGERVNLTLKFGLGYYYFEREFRYIDSNTVDEIDGEGFTPVVSFGIPFPLRKRENLWAEISVTHYFKDEAKTTGFGLSLKYQF